MMSNHKLSLLTNGRDEVKQDEEEVPTAHSHILRKYDCRSLTPPTSSKWPSPLAMSCPLKAHEKETSRTGSLATWQGNTMLSPTMISMSTGPWVILVGSEKKNCERESHFWRGGCQSHTEHEIFHCEIKRDEQLVFWNRGPIERQLQHAQAQSHFLFLSLALIFECPSLFHLPLRRGMVEKYTPMKWDKPSRWLCLEGN